MSDQHTPARIIAIDVETTGLLPSRDRLLELGAVCWEHGQEAGHFSALVNPGCPIPRDATRVHGITDTMVQRLPAIGEVLPAFLQFCAAATLVAHNAPFDIGFINAECRRQGLPPLTQRVIDSCELARQRIPGLRSYSLEALKRKFGLGFATAHRALPDARDCLAVYLRCQQITPPTATLLQPPAADGAMLALLREALASGSSVIIEYQDGAGRVTLREIRPLVIDGMVVEAYCLLRKETRHFYLERIRGAWKPGAESAR